MDRHMNIFRFYSEPKAEIENNLTRALAICLKYDPVFAFTFLSKVVGGINIDALPPKIILQKGKNLGEIGLDSFNKIYAVSITTDKLKEAGFESIPASGDDTDNPIMDLILQVNDDLLICEVKKDDEDCRAQLKNQVIRVIEHIDKNDGKNKVSEKDIIYKSMMWGDIIEMLEQTRALEDYAPHILVENFHELLLSRYPSWAPQKRMDEITLKGRNITSLINKRLRVITSLINKKLSTGPENESTEDIRINDDWAEIFYMKVQEASKSCPLAVVVLCWPGYIKRQGMFLYEDDKQHWDWLTFNGSKFDAGLGTTGELIASPYIRFYTRGKELTYCYIKDISLARELFSFDNFWNWTGKHEKKDWDKLHDFIDSHLSGKPEESWDEWKTKEWKAIRDSDRAQINMSMSAEFYVRFNFNDLAKMEEKHNDEEVVQFYIDVMEKMKKIVNDNKPYSSFK